MAPTRRSRPEPRPDERRLLYHGGLGALLGDLALMAGLVVVTSGGEVHLEYQVNDPVPLLPFSAYAFLGSAAVGAAAAALYARYRTASPPLVAVLVYASTVLHSWWTVRTSDRPDGIREGIGYSLGEVTAFEYALLAWPVILLAILVIGGLERWLRQRADPAVEGPPE